jgi:hypothetical protein
MYESLKAYSVDFHLFIFAFDDLTYDILKKLDLQYVTVISLNEFETTELLAVKNKRSKGEYCWTCTPSTISHILNNYKVDSCTYLDSDLFFYSDPAVLIQEMILHKRNVLITEHRFSPLAKIYEEKRAGRFCVQFVTFSNEEDSLIILEKWKSQCIDWCYARHEQGKFGDQKYLDEWPEIYNNVHILKNLGGGIAPWNILQYRFMKHNNIITGVTLKNNITFIVVFYHFQYVKFIEADRFDIGWYIISSEIRKLFYLQYIKSLHDREMMLHQLDSQYKTDFAKFKIDGVWSLIKIGLKHIFRYNLININ